MSMERHRNADGTYNGLAVMSEFTGLSQPDLKALWVEVKANGALLNACRRHDFAPPDAKGKRRICRNCGGALASIAAGWYEQGLDHAAVKL